MTCRSPAALLKKKHLVCPHGWTLAYPSSSLSELLVVALMLLSAQLSKSRDSPTHRQYRIFLHSYKRQKQWDFLNSIDFPFLLWRICLRMGWRVHQFLPSPARLRSRTLAWSITPYARGATPVLLLLEEQVIKIQTVATENDFTNKHCDGQTKYDLRTRPVKECSINQLSHSWRSHLCIQERRQRHDLLPLQPEGRPSKGTTHSFRCPGSRLGTKLHEAVAAAARSAPNLERKPNMLNIFFLIL